MKDQLREKQQREKEHLCKKQLYELAQSMHKSNMTVDELAAELWEYRSSLKGVLENV